MKTYYIAKLQYITLLGLFLCFSQTNSQSLEIDYFMHYSSNTASGFINPIFNAYNVQSFRSTNISSDSLMSKKKLKQITIHSSFAKLDTANRFIYIEEVNFNHRLQLEIEYPKTQTSASLLKNSIQHFSSFNNDPILCKNSFKLIKSKKGKLKYTYLWNPQKEKGGLVKTRHSYFGDVTKSKDLDCGFIQQTFFNHPVTCLPASYIYDFMYNCKEMDDFKMLKIDTCLLSDSAYYFVQYSKSDKKVFHCIIKFNYPYYSITQFRAENSEQELLTIKDQVYVWFDGKPDEYILIGRKSGQVEYRTYWSYNIDGNVSKVESIGHLPNDYWFKTERDFKYTYYNE